MEPKGLPKMIFIQKTVRHLWIFFNCVILASCSLTSGLNSKQGIQQQIRQAVKINNRQKLIVALQSIPIPPDKRKTSSLTTKDEESNNPTGKAEETEKLSKAFDFFLTEVHNKIQQGITNRDPDKIRSGLNTLSQLNPSSNPKTEDMEISKIRASITRLLERNLEIFHSGPIDESTYKQVAADYNRFMEVAQEQFPILVEKDQRLARLVMQKTQTAGPVHIALLASAIMWAFFAIAYFGVRSLAEQKLVEDVSILNKAVNSLCHHREGNVPQKVVNRIKSYGESYKKALHIYCEQSKEALDLFKEHFFLKDPGSWEIPESFCLQQSFSQLCPGRQWFCEVMKKAKTCFQEKRIDW